MIKNILDKIWGVLTIPNALIGCIFLDLSEKISDFLNGRWGE